MTHRSKLNIDSVSRARKSSFIDRSGFEYGRLKVLEYAGQLGVRKKTAWRCQCICGNEVVVRSDNLVAKKNPTRSCGCLQDESHLKSWDGRKLPLGEAPFRNLVLNYKRGAKVRGLDWDLSNMTAKSLFIGSCFYCGKPPSQVINRPKQPGNSFTYNGIDRVNNNLGYVPGNCVSCCKRCNTLKSNIPFLEFVDLIKTIANRLADIGY